jgi:hypothetical protein
MKHQGMFEKDRAQARENLAIQVVFVDPPKRPLNRPGFVGGSNS